MKLFDYIIAIFSSTMRDALELGKLNRIWEKFNDKTLTPEQTIEELLSHKWKFHKEKVKLLIYICSITTTYTVEA